MCEVLLQENTLRRVNNPESGKIFSSMYPTWVKTEHARNMTTAKTKQITEGETGRETLPRGHALAFSNSLSWSTGAEASSNSLP